MFYGELQETIEGRASDAGLEITLNSMSINDEISEDTTATGFGHQDTITEDNVAKIEHGDEHCDSLEVFCSERISVTQEALRQVVTSKQL